MEAKSLVLKKTGAHYGLPWPGNDFVVLNDDRILGRILWTHVASRDTPWFWTITANEPQPASNRGYSASQEQAMSDFKAALITSAQREIQTQAY